MLSDQNLFSYIFDEIKLESFIKYDEQIKNATISYKIDNDFISECNQKLIALSISYSKLPCENYYRITKQQFEEGTFCDKQNYQTKKGFSCCSTKAEAINTDGKNEEVYFCMNMKTDKNYQEFLKEEIQSLDVYNEVYFKNIEFDCPVPKEKNNLLIIILVPVSCSVAVLILIIIIICICKKRRNKKNEVNNNNKEGQNQNQNQAEMKENMVNSVNSDN